MRFSPLPIQHPVQPSRRLSPWRVLIAVVIVSGIVSSSVLGMSHWKAANYRTSDKPWFAGYVDVTSTPTFAFEQMGTTSHKDVVLSFIVSQPSDACTPTWGGAYTLDKASASLDLDRRIARLQQQGGSIAISFGGLKNHELAENCTDTKALYNAYNTILERYDVDTIDLDLENTGLTNTVAGARRAAVIAQLQKDRRSQGKKLAVWVTLPVAPQGLSEPGTTAVTQLLSKGVDLAGVNAMTMDYGSSRAANQSMLDASKSALVQTHRQLGILYQQNGVRLNSATVWAKIGATPMIGQNDISSEVFKLADAKGLNSFAHAHGIGRMSMWSANRDLACSGNYVNLKVVSDSCSGITQAKWSFTNTLSAGYKGSITLSAGLKTTGSNAKAVEVKDDPSTSPYPIWSATATYLEGTKIVLHRNVYQAKWWTQGDAPDDPVLQTWQTPWELVGPVLPNEKPIPQATLPAGTYPDWSGTETYNEGQRVLFSGVPYQAKWWTIGNSPAAASSNPDSSPWVPLTQTQINDVESTLKS